MLILMKNHVLNQIYMWNFVLFHKFVQTNSKPLGCLGFLFVHYCEVFCLFLCGFFLNIVSLTSKGETLDLKSRTFSFFFFFFYQKEKYPRILKKLLIFQRLCSTISL